jgi:hypothetical protein
MIVIFIIIFIMSNFITFPLQWMSKLAKNIVNNAGSDLGAGLDPDASPELIFSPTTEISALVTEFKEMVVGFGGGGAAKAQKRDVVEILNPYTFSDAQLHALGYTPKSAPSALPMQPVKAVAVLTGAPPVDNDVEMAVCSHAGANNIPMGSVPPYSGHVNLGRNITKVCTNTSSRRDARYYDNSLRTSPLFWWIVLLIIVPLIATMAVIGATTITKFQTDLPVWLSDVEVASVSLEQGSVSTTARLRAAYAEDVMSKPIRDLFIYSRLEDCMRDNCTTGLKGCGCAYPDKVCDQSNKCQNAPDANLFRLRKHSQCSLSGALETHATVPECEKACLSNSKCHGFMVESHSLKECHIIQDVCLSPTYSSNGQYHLYERRTNHKHTASRSTTTMVIALFVIFVFPLAIAFIFVHL